MYLESLKWQVTFSLLFLMQENLLALNETRMRYVEQAIGM